MTYMVDKGEIVGGMRGAVTFLTQARDALQKVYAEGEIMLTRADVDEISEGIKSVRKIVKEVDGVVEFYRQIVKQKEDRV